MRATTRVWALAAPSNLNAATYATNLLEEHVYRSEDDT